MKAVVLIVILTSGNSQTVSYLGTFLNLKSCQAVALVVREKVMQSKPTVICAPMDNPPTTIE